MSRYTLMVHFRKYIRLRECLDTTGYTDIGKCFICGEERPAEELVLRRFITSTNGEYAYDPRLAHLVCKDCFAASQEEYRARLETKFGKSYIKEVQKNSGNPDKLTDLWYESLEQHLLEEIGDMMAIHRDDILNMFDDLL